MPSSAMQRSATSSRRSTSPCTSCLGRSRCLGKLARAIPWLRPRRRFAASPARPTAQARRISSASPRPSPAWASTSRALPTARPTSKPRCSRSLQQDAGLVADQKLEVSAGKALKALDKTSTMPLTPFLKEAIETITSSSPHPPSPEAAKLIDASAEAIDAELLGVYLEESDEVLATIREHLDTVREHHANKEALTTIRRGFHTLKGSGRMVGLMRLGEAAWAVEQTMNAWVQEERAATPELLQLIELAHEYFSDNVKRLKTGGASSDERALVAAAERVRRGETSERKSPEALEAPSAPAAEHAGSAKAEPAPVAAAPVPVAPAEPEEFVQLGAHQVSTTLFAIFSGEARAHVSAIREEHETLRQHGVVSDALLRAVHTL